MSPEEQRIKIAEACGWTIHGSAMRIYGSPDDKFASVSACHDLYGFPRSGKDDWIPDYLNDLNAMHEAEKVLGTDAWLRYQGELAKSGLAFAGKCWIHATADQRAEALLRTLNLWVEEPVSEATVEGLR